MTTKVSNSDNRGGPMTQTLTQIIYAACGLIAALTLAYRLRAVRRSFAVMLRSASAAVEAAARDNAILTAELQAVTFDLSQARETLADELGELQRAWEAVDLAADAMEVCQNEP
jgi:hypothetical protein